MNKHCYSPPGLLSIQPESSREQAFPKPPRSPDIKTSKTTLPVPRIPLARYRLRFALSQPLPHSGYWGSAWRGVFGRALKQIVCINRSRDCLNCAVYRSCTYPYIFETPPPEDSEKLRGYNSAPHPYVLELPWRTASNSSTDTNQFELGLVLIGQANRFLTYILFALLQGAQKGLTTQPQDFRLISVSQEVPPASGAWQLISSRLPEISPHPPTSPHVPPPPKRFRVVLQTPLRLRHLDRYVTPERFQFRDLFANLLRRLSFLMYFHTPYQLVTNFAGLVDYAAKIPAQNVNLYWEDWTRYSYRQRTRMNMGGLMGSFDLDGTLLGPLWPYLWLGQFLHAGKGTTMGLGRYQIVPLQESTSPDTTAASGKLVNAASISAANKK